MLRKRANIKGDIADLRQNAERVALNRCIKQTFSMEMHKAEDFYDENLKALWGLCQRQINCARQKQLSRENIKEKFAELGIDGSVIDKFIEALDECEFQRYAPGDEQGNMSLTYDAAVKAITDIERSNEKPTQQYQ